MWGNNHRYRADMCTHSYILLPNCMPAGIIVHADQTASAWCLVRGCRWTLSWNMLTGHSCVQLKGVNGVTIYGPPPERGRAALCSFNVEGLHASDISTLLDNEGGGTCRKAFVSCALSSCRNGRCDRVGFFAY